jgi:transcriptional regulator with XRE-family HTH domain
VRYETDGCDEVLESRKISQGAKLCYVVLSNKEESVAGRPISVKKLAKKLGVTRQTIASYLKELKQYSLIDFNKASRKTLPTIKILGKHTYLRSDKPAFTSFLGKHTYLRNGFTSFLGKHTYLKCSKFEQGGLICELLYEYKNMYIIYNTKKEKYIKRKKVETEHLISTQQIEILFCKFYTEYPLKKSKAAAQKAFTQLLKRLTHKQADQFVEKLITAIRQQIHEKELKKKSGAWTPDWKFPSTWLNQQCWEDDINFNEEKKYENSNNRKPPATAWDHSKKYEQKLASEIARQTSS